CALALTTVVGVHFDYW
nr:immunoglobulin heavy chain junction region [Mus musculus]